MYTTTASLPLPGHCDTAATAAPATDTVAQPMIQACCHSSTGAPQSPLALGLRGAELFWLIRSSWLLYEECNCSWDAPWLPSPLTTAATAATGGGGGGMDPAVARGGAAARELDGPAGRVCRKVHTLSWHALLVGLSTDMPSSASDRKSPDPCAAAAAAAPAAGKRPKALPATLGA